MKIFVEWKNVEISWGIYWGILWLKNNGWMGFRISSRVMNLYLSSYKIESLKIKIIWQFGIKDF